jgi:RNA polymerase sigma factor (sigma-70 family)
MLDSVEMPDLAALQRGDGAEWEIAFTWLWPAAFHAARGTLQPRLSEDAEDVAIEALEELIEKVQDLDSVDDLRPLAATIAHHHAVSRLREHFAAKRGGGRIESLEARGQDAGDGPLHEIGDCPDTSLEKKESAEVLRRLLDELKPPQGEILADFFLRDLSYEQIAQKHGIAIGSVGVYLKRGLEAIRRIWRIKVEN